MLHLLTTSDNWFCVTAGQLLAIGRPTLISRQIKYCTKHKRKLFMVSMRATLSAIVADLVESMTTRKCRLECFATSGIPSSQSHAFRLFYKHFTQNFVFDLISSDHRIFEYWSFHSTRQPMPGESKWNVLRCKFRCVCCLGGIITSAWLGRKKLF